MLGIFSALWAALIPVVFQNTLFSLSNRLKNCKERAEIFSCSYPGELIAAITLSAWWVCLDWIRSWIFTGFPWGLFPVSQWQHPLLLQICEYTGIYGVDFLLIFCNFAIFFSGLELRNWVLGKKFRLSPVLPAAILLLGAVLILGVYLDQRQKQRFKDPSALTVFRVGVVQPDLSQRRAASVNQSMEAINVCISLSESLLSSPQNSKPELIVWPESAVPVPYYLNNELSGEFRKQVRTLLKKSQIPFLIGTITYEANPAGKSYDIYNSALLLRNSIPQFNDPFYDRVNVYSKFHLVPFGEFIPLNDRFPKIGRMVGMGRNLTPGKSIQPLSLSEEIRLGTVICYEDVFPYVCRKQAVNGANLLLVITNDAWYPTSFEPQQHYANSVFRSIETRLPMVRCGNSDYSVLIDTTGRTIDSASVEIHQGNKVLQPGKKQSCSAIFSVELPPDPENLTFYVRFGNLFVGLCWLLLLAGFSHIMIKVLQFRKILQQPFEPEPPSTLPHS